jgi:hypothetical protein
LPNIRRLHGRDSPFALNPVPHLIHVHAGSRLLLSSTQARHGCETSAETKSISKEITSVLHGSSS